MPHRSRAGTANGPLSDFGDANALVVTSSHEKIFCNGIDLDWLIPFIQKGGVSQAHPEAMPLIETKPPGKQMREEFMQIESLESQFDIETH